MLKELLKIYKNHNKFIPLLILGGVISAFTSVFMNYSMKNAVDVIFSSSRERIFFAIIVFTIMSILVFISDQIIEGYYVSKWNMLISKNVRNELFKSYINTGYKEALQYNLGHLMNVDDMVSQVSDTYISIFFSLPYAVLESVGFLIFLIVFVDWKMTIMVFLLIPMVFVTKAISEKIQDINERINKEKSELNNFFFDSISKLDFIKANDISHAVEKRYSAKNRAIVTIQKLLYRNNILYSMIQFLIENSIKFIVPIYGMYLYSIGDITPGGIAVCTTIFSSFLVPSTFQLLDMYKDIKAMAPSIHEVYSILCLPEQTNESNVLNVMPLPKDVLVELNNIAFNYNDSVDIIKNLSLTLPRAGSVGVCGLSGEGKSTLCKLIANLYMPYEGKITYNSLYFSNKENIRDSIAFVGNEAGFTQDSIYNNISGGGQEIYDAVKAVGMHDFVVNLAKGYETEISENDQNLSGGQKQLLLLARALAKNSSLLVLDEPTSSVDQETEKYMIELIEQVSKEKCVLVISHKLETLMSTDMIYICNQGHLEKLSKSDNVSDIISSILAEREKYV